MNNFLAGVVRRGAGMPSPVTIRPAMAPNIPVDAPSVPMPAGQEETGPSFSSAPDAMPDVRPVSELQEVRPKESLPKTDPQTPVALPEVAAIKPRSIETPFGSEAKPASVPVAEPVRITASVPAPNQDFAITPAREEVGVPEASPSPAPVTVILQPAQTAPPATEVQAKPEQRSESPLGVREQKTTAPPIAKSAAEPRNIQVKIGKVEIRSTQPPPPIPARRPPEKGGFDDYSLARNYLDRGSR